MLPATSSKQIRITLVKSLIGRQKVLISVVHALGLTKRNSVVVHYDTPTIMGMVNKIIHLVQIEPVTA
jgi:large subunit ribosomal protein L30